MKPETEEALGRAFKKAHAQLSAEQTEADAEAIRLAERLEEFVKNLAYGDRRLDAAVGLLTEAAATISRLAGRHYAGARG
jgi:exonuclease VII small subunit